MLSTSFGGCLFPDYETVAAGGGSGGELGAAGVTGGGNSGALGSAGSGAASGSDGGDACSGGGCPVPERCADGTDDDGDGRSDCFDDDCATDPACAGRCSDAAELPCDTVRTVKNSAAPGSTSRIGPPLYSCLGAEHEGPEFGYRFTGPLDREVFVQLYGLDGNLDLMLVDAAEGAACDATNDCTAAGNLHNDVRPEALAFTSLAGRSYFLVVDGPAAASYSLSIACSQVGGCRPARAIGAGQTIAASTAGSAANVTQNVSSYSCADGERAGPEAAFFFTPVEAGDYQVRLDAPTANVDLFVLGLPRCDGTCLTQNSASISPARQNESVTFSADANTGYYIVVDGNAPADFELSVTRL